MPIYLSMQRVRFSSPDAYEKFKVLFADTRRHLMTLPGFLHLTWWEHPDDRSWYNECSFWTSRGALYDWHKNTYHKYCKSWAANGAIMEDLITNFELVGTRLLRICPVCNHTQDKKYDLAQEQAVLREQCPQCEYHFPVLEETPSSFAVFKDAVMPPAAETEEKLEIAGGVVDRHVRWIVERLSRVRMLMDYELHLEVSKTPAGYRLKFEYDPRIFGLGDGDIERVTGLFGSILEKMLAHSRSRVATIITA